VDKQWHEPDCPNKPIPLLPDGASALIDDRAYASGKRRGGRTAERWKEAVAAEEGRKARNARLRQGHAGNGQEAIT
jgi:hypothetical protein